MLKVVELTMETAPQVRDLMYKVFGFTHSGKHLYDPAALMAKYEKGDFIPMMVADGETGTLLGYFDMGFPFDGREVAWFGCLALDPGMSEILRLAVLNTLMRDCIFKVGESFRDDGLRLVITTDTTDHTLSQRLSGQFGLTCVGLLFATVPQGEHQFMGAYRPQGTGDVPTHRRRAEVLSVYPAYKFIETYETYQAPRHAEMTGPVYQAMDLPAELTGEVPPAASGDTRIREFHDIVRGIVTLEIEEIGSDVSDVLAGRVDYYRAGFVPTIHVLVPQMPVDPEPAFEILEQLGGIYGGLFPRYKGRDMVVIQLVEPQARKVDITRLQDEAARDVARIAEAANLKQQA